MEQKLCTLQLTHTHSEELLVRQIFFRLNQKEKQTKQKTVRLPKLITCSENEQVEGCSEVILDEDLHLIDCVI